MPELNRYVPRHSALVVVVTAAWLIGFHRRFQAWFWSRFPEEGDPINLAIFRIVLFGTILLSFDPKKHLGL